MFGKGTWTIFQVASKDEATGSALSNFTARIDELASKRCPLIAISNSLATKEHCFGLAPYSRPRMGDEETTVTVYQPSPSAGKAPVPSDIQLETLISHLPSWTYNAEDKTMAGGAGTTLRLTPVYWPSLVSDWSIHENVYGLWLMSFDYKDVTDTASKKEARSYDYGCPFNLQSAELKKEITAEVTQALTFTRKHLQVIFDFDQNLLWVNSNSPKVIKDIVELVDDLGLTCQIPEGFHIDDIDYVGCLQHLVKTSSIKEVQVRRLQEQIQNGKIEPDQDPFIEKLTTAFFAYAPLEGGDYVGLAPAAEVALHPGMVSTAAKSVTEAVEFIETSNDSILQSAEATFTQQFDLHRGQKDQTVLAPSFTIQMEAPAGVEGIPGVVIRNAAVKDFKQVVKTHVTANDGKVTIADYWYLYYTTLKQHVYQYFNTLKDLTETI